MMKSLKALFCSSAVVVAGMLAGCVTQPETPPVDLAQWVPDSAPVLASMVNYPAYSRVLEGIMVKSQVFGEKSAELMQRGKALDERFGLGKYGLLKRALFFLVVDNADHYNLGIVAETQLPEANYVEYQQESINLSNETGMVVAAQIKEMVINDRRFYVQQIDDSGDNIMIMTTYLAPNVIAVIVPINTTQGDAVNVLALPAGNNPLYAALPVVEAEVDRPVFAFAMVGGADAIITAGEGSFSIDSDDALYGEVVITTDGRQTQLDIMEGMQFVMPFIAAMVEPGNAEFLKDFQQVAQCTPVANTPKLKFAVKLTPEMFGKLMKFAVDQAREVVKETGK